MHHSFKITQTVRVNNDQVFLNDKLVIEFADGKPVDIAEEQPASRGTDFATACYRHLSTQYPKFYKMDLMSKWGIICATLLLQKESPANLDEYKRAIILQNASSSLLTDRKFQRSTEKAASPALFAYTLPNIVLGEIAIMHHFKGESTFFVSPAFDEARLNEYCNLLFENNIAEFAICGFLEVTDNTQQIVMWSCVAV